MNKNLLTLVAVLGCTVHALGADMVVDGVAYNYTNASKSALEMVALPEGDYSGEIVVAQSIDGIPVTRIADNVCRFNENITSVTLPEGLLEVGYEAFRGCINAHINVPSSLTYCGDRAFNRAILPAEVTLPTGLQFPADIREIFARCSGMTRLIIPEGVTTIAPQEFQYCPDLTEIEFPSTMVYIGQWAFEGCSKLARVNFPSVEIYNDGLFDSCSKLGPDMILPEGVKYIDGYCASSSVATTLSLPSSLEYMDYQAFRYCNAITEVVINGEENAKPLLIGNGWSERAFQNAKIVNVYIGRNVAKGSWPILQLDGSYVRDEFGAYIHTDPVKTYDIDSADSPFYGFKTLKTVTVGQYVTDLIPFTSNTAIESVTCEGSVPPAYCEFADVTYANAILTVPVGAKDAYSTHPMWKKFANIVEAAPVVTYEPAVMPVDAAKVACWIGEGDSRAILAIRWNEREAERAYNKAQITSYANCKAMDNMVMGVRFNSSDGLTAQQIVDLAVAGNPRLRSTGADNYGYDMIGSGKALHATYDHNRTNTAELTWKLLTAPDGKYEPSLDNGQAITDGTVIYLDYSDAAATQATPFENIFYIPALDEVGVWLPENYVFHFYDGMVYLPLYVNVGEGGKVSTYKFTGEAVDPDAPIALESTFYLSSGASAGYTRAQMASSYQTGIPAKHIVNVTAVINNATYSASGVIDVREPVVPLQGFTFTPELTDIVIPGYPNYSYFKPVFVPNPINATFTDHVWESSDPQVASVTQINGGLNAEGKQGTTTISIYPLGHPELAQSYNATLQLNQLVEGIQYGDGTSHTIHGTYLDIFCLKDAKVTPDNADNKKMTYTIEEGKSDIATVYASTGDLINYKPGSIDVTFSTTDGSNISDTYTFVFDEPNRNPSDDEYQDGFFWLNEDWYTHRCSSINYFRADGEIIYRAYETQNPYQAFGATSQYGMIYGGRLYICSKQTQDGGDPRPGGGRLVVADAKTLKKVAAFDIVAPDSKGKSADSRACVGVTPEKVYLGTTNGIQVINVDPEGSDFSLGNVISLMDGDGVPYQNEIGNMVEANGYVFAVMQSKGLVIIDGSTDTFVKCIPETNAAAVVRALDGDVYFAGGYNLYRIDPNTLEADAPMTLPTSITAAWSAWRSTLMFASPKENVIFFAKRTTGFSPGMGDLYRYEIGQAMPTAPLFVPTYPVLEGKKTSGYAAAGYDYRTNEIMAQACMGAGSYARYNALCRWDATTGEAKEPVRLKDYFWFPAMPIYPDKYDPEINIDQLTIDLQDEEMVIDFEEHIVDLDNPFSHIKIDHAIVEVPSTDIALYDAVADAKPSIEMGREGSKLTIKPATTGKHELTLTAVANGKRVTKVIPVEVTDQTGVSSMVIAKASIDVEGSKLVCRNLAGQTITIFDINGRIIKRFNVDADRCEFYHNLGNGVYVARSSSGTASKIVIR